MDKQPNKTPYITKLQQIKLSDTTRERIGKRLSEFADFHTIPESERVPEADRLNEGVSRTSVWNTASFIRVNRNTMPALALIAAAVIGGSTSLAAQNSLPNDLLYPVKVNFNENIRSALALSADAEAALQVDLLAERVEEAALLQANGQLDGELAARVRTNVAAQADAANQANDRVDESIKVESDNQIRLALEHFNGLTDSNTLLAVHTEAAAAANNNEQSAKAAVVVDSSEGVATMRATSDASSAPSADETLRISADAAVGTMLAFEPVELSTLLKDANKRIISLQKLLVRYQSEIKSDLYTEYQEKLSEAAELMAQANTQTEAEARQTVATASDLAGQVESGLSLLGTVSINPETGAIIEIDFSVVPPLSIPPTKPEAPDPSSQPIDHLETSIETGLENVLEDTTDSIEDIGNSIQTNTSAEGILDISL